MCHFLLHYLLERKGLSGLGQGGGKVRMVNDIEIGRCGGDGSLWVVGWVSPVFVTSKVGGTLFAGGGLEGWELREVGYREVLG